MSRGMTGAAAALALCMGVALAGCRVSGPTGSPPVAGSPGPDSGSSGLASASPTGLSQHPSPSAGPAVTPPTSPAASAVPSVGPEAGVTWQLADNSVFSSADVVSDAAALGALVVAVGSSEDAQGNPVAAAWYSLDGSRWARADALPQAALASIESVAVGPAGLVAVGFDDSGDSPRPAAWLSTDGRSWSRSADLELANGQMAAVAGGAAGYVALGSDPDDGRSLFWTSADGADWSPATQVPGVEVEATINGLATIGEGFIAYGTSAENRAQMWLSLDGLHWQPVPGFASEPDSTVSDIALSGERFVAVGARYLGDSARALAWISDDGLTWQRQAVELDGEMIGVEPVGTGFYAVGAVPEANELVFAAGVWSSPDGAAWQRRPADASFELARMIELFHAGPGLVVIGEKSLDAAGEELAPAVWVGTPE